MSEFKKEPCFLTKEEALFEAEHSSGRFHYKSDACNGWYAIIEDAAIFLNTTVPHGTIVQGLINCARRTLEIKIEGKGQRAAWTTRDNLDRLQAVFDEEFQTDPRRDRFVACAVEDYFNEPVDHALKPIHLLESFTRRLSQNKAYSKFQVSLADRIWARIADREELVSVLTYLRDEKLIDMHIPPGIVGISEVIDRIHNMEIQMTPRGWEEMRKRNSFPNTNKVFIATQFEWPKEQELQNKCIAAIKRACSSLGYEADVVSQGHTGNITDKIIAEIKRARFLVAELTYNNRGVYFESGFARGLGIPVFHVVRDGFTSGDDKDGRKIHFDIAQVMYRTWKTDVELEEKLTDWIESSIGRFQ